VGLLALCLPCPAEELEDDSQFTAFELRDLAPDKLVGRLERMKATYRGQTPEELLQLLEMLQSPPAADEEALLGQPEADANRARAVGLVLDLLHEWPSAEQNRAILARLEGDTPEQRYPGLLAGDSAAQDPAVAEALLGRARLHDGPGALKEAVLATRAMANSRNAKTEPELERLAASESTAVSEAAAVSLRQLRTALGKWKPPPLNHDTSGVRVASVSSSRVLSEYRSLPTKPFGEEGVEVVIVQVSQRDRNPFSSAVTTAMTQVLRGGGTVVISNPLLEEWPDELKQWAHKHQLSLPAEAKAPPTGPGIPSYAHYRSFADYPFSLRDQPGPAADLCWTRWGKGYEAPILSCDRRGALAVVADKVLGGGRLLFTTVDLPERPIYNENLLRWVYGDSLLSHTFQWTKTYSMETTGHTPHKAWARPLAGEKPKMLYLTLATSKRGLLEVVQRMDAEWRYVPYDGTFAARPRTKEHVPPSRMGQRAVALLETCLPWADVLVCDVGPKNMIRTLTSNAKAGVASLQTVPARLRRAIYRRVRQEGMGLVCVSSRRADHDIQEFVARVEAGQGEQTAFQQFSEPLVPVPGWQDDEKTAPRLLSTDSGKGRMLWFGRYLPHILDISGASTKVAFPEEYSVPGLLTPQQPVKLQEYWYAMLVKAVLWSCRRDNSPGIRALSSEDKGAGSSGEIKVQLTEEFSGTVELAVRDAWNRVVPLEPERINGSSLSMAAPALPEGWYIVEVILRDGEGRTVDFGAKYARVASAVKIAAVSPMRRFWREGESARLKVSLSAPTDGVMRVEATDTFGRKTFGQTKDLGGRVSTVEVEVPVVNALSRLWDIHLTLVKDGKLISYWRQPVGIEKAPSERDFTILAGCFSREEEIPLFLKYISIDSTLYAPGNSLRNNMDLRGNSTHHVLSFGHAGTPGARLVPTEREPCMSSPAFRMQAIRDIRARWPVLRALGVESHMINDECPHGGRCFSRHCLERFRWWLRQQYGELAALNREWATTFESWDEVMPLQGEDARHPGSYADFELFSKWVFAEYSSFLEILANDYVPGFRAGHSSGPFGSFMHELGGLAHYYGVVERYVSTGPPGAVLGSWYGPGYRFIETHETTCRHWPWWHLFRGTTRIALWWNSSGLPGYHSDFSRPYMSHVWLGEEMRDISRGLGKLLLHVRRDEGPVATYADAVRNRIVVNTLEEVEKKRKEMAEGLAPGSLKGQHLKNYPRRASRLQRAFLDQQVECRVIGEYQIESGAIDARGLELIFLPGVVSLSSKEREALRRFVEKGGVLVADLNVGLRNEHGTWVGDSFAREFFGVSADEGFRAFDSEAEGEGVLTVDGEIAGDAFPAMKALGRAKVTACGRGVKVTGGTALANIHEDTPALILKEHGVGKCVFLNFTVPTGSDYAGALTRDLLRLAGLEPVVKVGTQEGKLLPLDFGLYRDGDALYSGFVMRGKGGMISGEETRKVTVTSPSEGHLYDARRGKYLGRTRVHGTEVLPSIAHVYALLPYKLKALNVQGEQKCERGAVARFVVTAHAEEGQLSGRQVWLVVARDPAGKLQDAYTKKTIVGGGRAEFAVPIALNAARGTWKLNVRDAATGVTGQAVFEVQP